MVWEHSKRMILRAKSQRRYGREKENRKLLLRHIGRNAAKVNRKNTHKDKDMGKSVQKFVEW